MAHGWNSYFPNLQPLPSDPRALSVPSDARGNLAQHMDSLVDHHDFSNMVDSPETPSTNLNLNSNFYGNSSTNRSDCVYDRYYGEVPWQTSGQQNDSNGPLRCRGNNLPNFSTDGLSTSGNFHPSLPVDLHGLNQECGMLNSSFYEGYSDVATCSEADINTSRPSCKLMGKKPDEMAISHKTSEWAFTPVANMSSPVESGHSDGLQETPPIVQRPYFSNANMQDNVVRPSTEKTEMVYPPVKVYPENDQVSYTSTNSTLGSEAEDVNYHGYTQVQQFVKHDMEEKEESRQESHNTSAAGSGNLAEDDSEEKPLVEKQEQTGLKSNVDQQTNLSATNNMFAFDSDVKDDLHQKVQENDKSKTSFDSCEDQFPDPMSMESQEKECTMTKVDPEEEEIQSSTYVPSDIQDDKESDPQDNTSRANQCTRSSDVDGKEKSDTNCSENCNQGLGPHLQSSKHQEFDSSMDCSDDIKNTDIDSSDESENKRKKAFDQHEDKNTDVDSSDKSENKRKKAFDQHEDKNTDVDSSDESENKRKEAFDQHEDKHSSVISKDSQDVESALKQPDQKEEMQSYSCEPNDTLGNKEADSQDAADKTKQCTDTMNEASIHNSAINKLDSSSKTVEYIGSGLQDTTNIDGIDCKSDSVDEGETNQPSSIDDSESCLEQENPRMNTENADDTNASSSVVQEQSAQQTVAVGPTNVHGDLPQNTRDLPKEENSPSGQQLPAVVNLYGEPISGGSSDCEADETKSQLDHTNGSTPTTKDNETTEPLEVQATTLKSYTELEKCFQPIVIIKTSESTKEPNGMYQCTSCQTTTQNVNQMIEHYQCIHSNYSFQFCETCNIYLTKAEGPHLCSVPGELPGLPVNDNIKIKKKTPRYKCKYCSETFRRIMHYVKHVRLHTGKTPYRCPKCDSYFAQSSSLRKHQRIPGRCQGKETTVPKKNSNTSSKTMQIKKNDLLPTHAGLPQCFVKLVDIRKTNICSCGKSFPTQEKLKKHKYKVHKIKSGISTITISETSLESGNIQRQAEKTGQFKCPLCPRVFKYTFNRTRHLRDCLRDLTYGGKGKVGGKYPCPLCHATFTLASNRCRHVKGNRCLKEYLSGLTQTESESKKIKVVQSNTKTATTASEGNARYYRCTLCPAVFFHSSGKYRHMKKHEMFKTTGKLFKYRNSSFASVSKQTVLKSQKTEEQSDTLQPSEAPSSSSSSSFTCQFCEEEFSSSYSLKRHERNHKGERPYRCLECRKGFKKQAHLLAHKIIHQRRIQCTVCRKILPTIGELIMHRKSHLKRGLLQCPDCPMTFPYPVYLIRHLSTHKQVKGKALEVKEKQQQKPQQPLKDQEEHVCSICKATFSSASMLHSHCRTHLSGSSPHQCPLCKRVFTCRRNVLRHMLIHTPEKTHSCTRCGKQIFRKSQLKLHHMTCQGPEIKHKTEDAQSKYQLKCDYCPRVFTRSNRLKSHHHGHKAKTLVSCSKCRMFFGRMKLAAHEKRCNAVSDPDIDSSSPSCNLLRKDDQKPSIETRSKKIQHNCPHCQEKFKYRSLLLRHIVKHKREQHYTCMHCGLKYESKSVYLQHEAFCDGVFKERSSKRKSEVATKLLFSPGLTDAKQKSPAEGESEFKCKFCTKTFTKSRNLRRHILTHTEVKPYHCKTCDNCFSRYDHLKLHQTRCKGKRQQLEVHLPKISQEYLGKIWQDKLNKLETTNLQTFDCTVCKKRFSTKSNLARHNSMLHNTNKSFSCNRCGGSYTSEKSLIRHKRLNICERTSVNTLSSLQEKSNLRKEGMAKLPHGLTNHIVHKIEPPKKKWKYACQYCPRFFKGSEQLKVHTRLHTGEKPYHCDRCGERFIRKDYLRRHAPKCNATTGSVDSKLCDRCGGVFPKDKLSQHQQNCTIKLLTNNSQPSPPQSPPKGFSCAYCSSRFLLFSQLQQHFLYSHKQDIVLKPPISAPPLQQQLSSIKSVKEEPSDEGYGETQLRGDGNLLFSKDNLTDDEIKKPYACRHCKMRFVNKGGLGGHMRIHSGDYPFACKKCNRGFWNRNLQRNHFRKCKFGISDTNVSNAESESLNTVEMDQTQNESVLVFNQNSKAIGTGVLQTNFSCKDDSKDAPCNSSEEQPQKSFPGEKKAVQYQCSECDQSFTDGLMLISHLEDHGRMELEKKRNTCSQCGKICSSAAFLEKHMKVHTIQKTTPPPLEVSDITNSDLSPDPNRQYVCRLCNLRCGNSQNLCNHYSEAHPNDVYSCPWCDKTYSLKKSLARHCKNRHPGRKKVDSPTREKDKTDQDLNAQDDANCESDTENDDEHDGSEDADSDSAPYFPCHVCGKTFPTSESLEDHQRCHLGEKPHECAECGKCFFQASQLQQHQRTHKSEYQCQICGRGFVSFFALRKHKHSHGKSRPYRCSKCPLSFKGRSQLADHMTTHRDDNFPCDICNRTFSCKSSRAEHRKSHSWPRESVQTAIAPEEEKESSSHEIVPVTSKLKYRCGVCNDCFRDPEELSEHGCMAADERPYPCLDCHKYFLHVSHLKKHRLLQHVSQAYVYQCNPCSMSFAYHQHYINHLKQHKDETGAETKSKPEVGEQTPSSTFKCPFCPEHFAKATTLIDHFSTHSDTTYECKICKLTFSSKSKLKEHERCHLTAATQYECTECGQSFLGSDAFRKHHCSRLQHGKKEEEHSRPSTHKTPVTAKQAVGEEEDVDVTGEDFHNCPHCSKRFSSKRALLEHQNKHHASEQPFKCEFCDKTFSLRKSLKEHERRHRLTIDKEHKAQQLEKRYKCSQCPVTLDTTQALSLHMREHAEEEVGDHRCDMCYKSFSQLHLLRQHQESHVGQVVYECTECDKAFAFPYLLEKHQRTHSGSSV